MIPLLQTAELNFSHPEYLLILLFIPIMIITHLLMLKRSQGVSIKFANFEALERIKKGSLIASPYKGKLFNRSFFLLLLRIMTYSILILSITGMTLWYETKTSEFDYTLAIDVSSSMLADDIPPNRLDSAKGSAIYFLDQISHGSKIGLVIFSGVTRVESRLEENKKILEEKINAINLLESGGTNIGDAIITSSNLLIESSQDKAIILLTDGQSNIGTDIDEALHYTTENNIRVHTIGIATEEGGSFKNLNITTKIDESSLQHIAETTHGIFFKAETKDNLDEAFSQILKTSVKRVPFDMSWILLIIGLILLTIEWLVTNTKYRVVPS